MIEEKLRLRADLERLQYGHCARYVRYKPLPFGLGAQITGRLETLILALALERKAIFDRDDPPYGQIFVPLHRNFEQTSGHEVPLNPLLDQEENGIYYSPAEISIKSAAVRDVIKQRVCERLFWPLARWTELEGELFNWMTVVPDIAEYCGSELQRLGVDGDTLGVHYRRGDKRVETAYVPAHAYNAAISAVHATWKFSKLFIASDSPNALAEIEAPHGVAVIFDTTEQRYNNANHRMLFDRPELAEAETKTAFKNIWLLAQCGGVVGQDNAHFAVLSAASVAARTGTTRGKLIEGKMAQNNSRSIAYYFEIKAALRAILRRLAPWATASARLKRRNRRVGK